MKRRRAALLLAALAAAGCSGPQAGDSPRRASAPSPENTPAVTPAPPEFDRDAILDEMAGIIAHQIAQPHTKHPVFHGCVDWHSSVHGHWALFRIARATGRHADRAAAADASLDPAGLEKELARLRREPKFERPYGRAWALLLAEEFERWSTEEERPDPKRLRPLADECARSLAAFYEEKGPSAESAEYDNACWAVLRLLQWHEFAGDAPGLAKARAWAEALCDQPAPAGGWAADATRPEFFSRAALRALLAARVRPGTLRAPADADLAPVVRLAANPHHLGTNWSRAWRLKALAAATGEARCERAFAEHVAEGMRHHALNRGNVWAYDHWVPQFAVYALTE